MFLAQVQTIMGRVGPLHEEMNSLRVHFFVAKIKMLVL